MLIHWLAKSGLSVCQIISPINNSTSAILNYFNQLGSDYKYGRLLPSLEKHSKIVFCCSSGPKAVSKLPGCLAFRWRRRVEVHPPLINKSVLHFLQRALAPFLSKISRQLTVLLFFWKLLNKRVPSLLHCHPGEIQSQNHFPNYLSWFFNLYTSFNF